MTNIRPTREMFVGEEAIFEGFVVEEGTGHIVNPELGLTAFIAGSQTEGYYKCMWTSVESVERSIAYQKERKGLSG